MDQNLDIIQVCATIKLIRQTSCDTVTTAALLNNYIMQKNVLKALLDSHPYAISPYCRGGFCTKVNDPAPGNPKRRRNLTAATKEELYIMLAEFYGTPHNEKGITLDQLYLEWKDYRIKVKTPVNTVTRDDQRYKKYFAHTAFFKKDVTKLRRSDWKEFCCSVIAGETRSKKDLDSEKNKMTHKEWSSTRCILNGMLELAKDKEYITINPLLGMKYEKHLFRAEKRKAAETQTFNELEQTRMTRWCIDGFQETHDPAFLIPPLLFMTGLRIGECTALTWDCWDKSRSNLYICKSEYKDRLSNVYSVQPHTKTHNDRFVPLNADAAYILNLLHENRQSDTWIFARVGERVTSRQAGYVLQRYAKETDSDVKSSHKLRKTFGSELYKAGLTPLQCSEILGNSPEVFMKYYCYNTDTDEEILNAVESVGLHGLRAVI